VLAIGQFALIINGVLQVVRKLDSSVVINTFQSSNNVVLDLLPTESASIVDNMDYDFWPTALGHHFTAFMNRNL
jgi:hypothetical protein